MAATVSGSLDINELPISRRELTKISFENIIEAISPELSKIFELVSVEVIQCPNLTQPPFYLAAEGLSGNETAMQFGGLPYVMPFGKKEKLYDMKDIMKITGFDPLFVVGAGAGPWPYANICSEFIGNLRMTSNNSVNNRSHIYTIDPKNDQLVHEELPQNETRFSHMAHFFTSNGFRGEVLKIVCEKRIDSVDFVTSIRLALKKYFGNETVVLGGVILIENGKVKVHVCPDYSKTPLDSEKKLKDWLKIYDLPTPLVCLGYVASHDAGLDMMPLQHFHVFSDHGSGGHYMNDVEPATIKYTAYFNIAKNFIRVDQPEAPFSFENF
ncbi:ester hydrolase C11orf54 homolog [Sipha flava]|uniref:Ester hydrolase n=1 Tax=Sipha flava TaxID=143950 RepID=A0A2S2Q981_9HEMI|nr:ester hydrolase C11orf54 homolog [Sipha flava]